MRDEVPEQHQDSADHDCLKHPHGGPRFLGWKVLLQAFVVLLLGWPFFAVIRAEELVDHVVHETQTLVLAGVIPAVATLGWALAFLLLRHGSSFPMKVGCQDFFGFTGLTLI